MDDEAVIANNMTRLRKAAGMSQAGLADAMQAAGATHWHQNTVSRIERGQQELTMRDIGPLRRILPGVFAGTDLAPQADRPGDLATLRGHLHDIERHVEDALAQVRSARAAIDG